VIKGWLKKAASGAGDALSAGAEAAGRLPGADTVKRVACDAKDAAGRTASGTVAAARRAGEQAADSVELVKIGTRLQSLLSASDFARWQATVEALVARGVTSGAGEAPEALKMVFDPAHLSTMWELSVRVFKAVVFLRSTLRDNPQLAEPLKEVLASIRALRAVKSAEDAERCVRDLETKLKRVKSLIGDDGGMIHTVIDTIIEGLANTLAGGCRLSGDFLVGIALGSIDTHLLVLELILSFCLE
jgi:hypothetical protein